MMKTLVISMLALMLVITVVFTSFGIAYSKTDFVGLVVDVERRTGEFSQFCIDEYKTISAGVKDILTRLKPMFDVLGDVANALLDFFNSHVVSFIVDAAKYIGAFFKYLSYYGIHLDINYFAGFSMWYSEMNAFLYEDGTVNYGELKALIDCVIYDVDNGAYGYYYQNALSSAKSLRRTYSYDTTYFIGPSSSTNIDSAALWFVGVSPEIPASFMSGSGWYLRALFWQHQSSRGLPYSGIVATNITYTSSYGDTSHANAFRLSPRGFKFIVPFAAYPLKCQGIYYDLEFRFVFEEREDAPEIWIPAEEVYKQYLSFNKQWYEILWLRLSSVMHVTYSPGVYTRSDNVLPSSLVD